MESALFGSGLYVAEKEIVSDERTSTEKEIARLVNETGCTDPREAIRIKARELIALYCDSFGVPTMPIDVHVLASLRGIAHSDEAPVHSKDAELVPDGSGGVAMRVSADRPETRQRFSIGHEITHTFFPGYELKVQCRPDSRYRKRDDPDDAIESLCDIGASELLFPMPWFGDDARVVSTGEGLMGLAKTYKASREATARRFAEVRQSVCAAVFLSWKLKPTQAAAFNPDQPNLFGTSPEDDAWAARQLRIDYAIPSESFTATGLYLPGDKSFVLEGPIGGAAKGEPAEGESNLDLGQSSGRYRVIAIPVYTPAEERGPSGESAVIAVIEPLGERQLKRKKKTAGAGPSLFEALGQD